MHFDQIDQPAFSMQVYQEFPKAVWMLCGVLFNSEIELKG